MALPLIYISDPLSTLVGAIMVIIAVSYCCMSVNDSGSSKSSYNSSRSTYKPRNNYSGRSYDEEYSYNWDDSWDDKWLHQGKYADEHKSHEEYTDYDPSWMNIIGNDLNQFKHIFNQVKT